MSPPCVSIVVPVFNAGPYLAETLESLLDQDYPDLEIIVIDDGSTDGSWEVMQRYTNRCRISRQANQGQSATLNRGWEMATGTFVGYLSADDTLEPHAVSRLVEALQADPQAVLAYPDYWLMDHRSRCFRTVTAPDFDYSEVLLNGICPAGPGMLFTKRVLTRVGGWNDELRQIPDYEFLLRIGLCGTGIHVAEKLARFRVHQRSQTFAIADESRVAEYDKVLADHFARDDIDPKYRRLQRQAEASASILMARGHLRARRFASALGCIAKASWRHPPVLLKARTWRVLMNGVLDRMVHDWRIRHMRYEA